MSRISLVLALVVVAPASAAGQNVDQFGDPLPPGAVARLGTARWRHGDGYFGSVAFLNNDKIVAIGAADGTIRLCDVASGKELRRLDGHRDSLRGLLPCAAGKQLLSASSGYGQQNDNSVRLWDVASGRELRHIDLRPGAVTMLAMSADEKTLVLGLHRAGVQVWDLATFKPLRRFGENQGTAYSLALSPDGGTLATVGEDFVTRLWDVASGQQIRALEPKGEAPPALRFLAAGKTLLANSGSEFRFWEVSTGKLVRRIPCRSNRSRHFAVSFDEKTLVAAQDDCLARLWELESGREIGVLDGPNGDCFSLAFSCDGSIIAARGRRITRLWETATQKPRNQLQAHEGEVWSIAVTPDGKMGVTCSYEEESGVRLWELQTGKPSSRITAPRGVWWVVCSPDGTTLAASAYDGVPKFWDARSGGALVSNIQFPAPVGSVIYSPNGTHLASTDTNSIHLWDIQSGKETAVLKKAAIGRGSICFTPAGERIVEQDQQGTVWIHNIAKRETSAAFAVKTAHTGAIDLSPDGRTIACSHRVRFKAPQERVDGPFLRLFELATGQERIAFGTHADGYVRAIFSPDGKALITGGDDKVIRFWDATTGLERRSLIGHEGSVVSLAVTPNGRQLVSGSSDTTALVWDIAGFLGPQASAEAAPSAKDLDSLYSTLASPDASAAYKAIWSLVAAPKKCVPLLAEKLKPAVAVDEKHFAQLSAALDSDAFAEREKASAELAKLGELAGPALEKLLKGNPSQEARRRGEALVAKLGGPVTSPEQLRTLRAIEALEYIGTPEARQVIEKLAAGAAGARETEDAKRTLERLKKRNKN